MPFPKFMPCLLISPWLLICPCLLISLIVTGCAGLQTPEHKSGELHFHHAGDPVDRIRFTSILGWEPVGSETVMVRVNGNRHFLLELTPECAIDLRWAAHLSLQNRTPHQLSTFDRVALDATTCRITAIRPVDHEALRAALAAG